MGNSSAKSAACKEALLSLDSQQIEALDGNFKRVAALKEPKDRIDGASLGRELGLGSDLEARLFRAMHKAGGTEKAPEKGLKYDNFVVALTKCCSSSRYDKRQFWISVIGESDGKVSKATLQSFFKVVIGMTLKNSVGSSAVAVDSLAKESVVQAFDGVTGEAMSEDQASAWLQREQATEDFFSKLMSSHFLVDRAGGDVDRMHFSRTLPRLSRPSRLLHDHELWVLGAHLPPACQDRPWKCLFSSVKHGQSFARLMGKMVFKGPTVLVVKDKEGATFGAFCAVSWHKDNKFFGESSTFVFTLTPKLKVYRSSGVNQNYMFLSTSLTSCTNGLGIGGQKDYWGVHLDTMLEGGVCRAPCSTFEEMPCLASDVRFAIEEVEAWGCVPDYVADEKELEAAGVKRKKPKTWEEYERRANNSVLDKNLEAKAILEAAGHTNHSDDVRAADAAMEKDEMAQRIAAGQEDVPSDEEEVEYEDM